MLWAGCGRFPGYFGFVWGWYNIDSRCVLVVVIVWQGLLLLVFGVWGGSGGFGCFRYGFSDACGLFWGLDCGFVGLGFGVSGGACCWHGWL